jgi:ATP-dependent Clp protease ATP-binding subunit ClpB
MPIDDSNPRWLREVALALPSSPQIILTGNVRDYHAIGEEIRGRIPSLHADPTRLDTVRCLGAALDAEGVPVTLVYDPVDGLRTLETAVEGDAAGTTWKVLLESASGEVHKHLEEAHRGPRALPKKDAEDVLGYLVKFASESSAKIALILDFASWVAPVNGDAFTGSDVETELPRLLRRAAKAASTAHPYPNLATGTMSYNPVVWVTRQQADLPGWLVTAPGMRLVSIELPSARTRETYGRSLLMTWPGWRSMPEDEQQALVQQFTSATEGLTLKDGANIVGLAPSLEGKLDWSAKDRLRAAERVFRIGVAESQWDNPGLIGFLMGDGERPDAWTLLGSRVTGQPAATGKTADVLTRSAVGLSGAETGGASANRPKGVLFLAGPTGTGKTLLAKSIAGILNQDLEDFDSYIRFDMSEYSAEHTEARLVGAPPGYVGHDAGGQLTEAVRQRPFSVLLFDEIEKAHPRILDKFLQILDEGRLTDGTGVTVSFSETFIVFTSNLGVTSITQGPNGEFIAAPRYTYRQWEAANAAEPGTGYEELEREAQKAIKEYFTETIQRPELLNRIGTNNVVIFDYISDDAATTIIDAALDGIVGRFREKHGAVLSIADGARAEIEKAVKQTQYLEMGGRGLNSGIENLVVNPLARAFARMIGARVEAPTAVELVSITPEVELR